MKRLRIVCISSLLILASEGEGQSGWVPVPSPNPGPDLNILRGISGTDTTNVWAVGNFRSTPEEVHPSVIENLLLQWDGNEWIQHQVQNFSALYNVLWDVHAFANDNVWAVGDHSAGGGMARPQIHHWNGTEWSSEAIVPDGGGAAFVYAMDATGPADIWLAGGKAEVGVGVGYILHFDGSEWTELTAPPVGDHLNWFHDVSVLAPDDVWAVGFHNSLPWNVDRFMIMHWDGDDWSNVPLPDQVANITGGLRSVQMISPTEGWASTSFSSEGPVVLHWNGNVWNVAQIGTPSRRAFAPLAYDDMYAFGSTISHWNGNNWTTVDELVQYPYPALSSSTVLSDGGVWAAGNYAEINGDTWTLVYRQGDNTTSMGPDMILDDALRAYPDPFTDDLTLELGRSDNVIREVRITQLASGSVTNVPHWEHEGNGRIKIDLSSSDLAPGAYVITVVTSEGVRNVKVIKV